MLDRRKCHVCCSVSTTDDTLLLCVFVSRSVCTSVGHIKLVTATLQHSVSRNTPSDTVRLVPKSKSRERAEKTREKTNSSFMLCIVSPAKVLYQGVCKSDFWYDAKRLRPDAAARVHARLYTSYLQLHRIQSPYFKESRNRKTPLHAMHSILHFIQIFASMTSSASTSCTCMRN